MLGFLFFFVPTGIVAYGHVPAGPGLPALQRDTTTINRVVDVGSTSRNFPNLVAYRNTSLQKAPAPVIAEVSEKELGRPEMTRCWLNLDEMWDYRTGKYDFNFKIGVDKYKDVKEKHRETWDWEIEAPIKYYDYLKSFSTRSDEIMLNIRRYERDILDGTLPMTMQDWKKVFKEGLKHYKMLYANIRYVELGNEYGHRFFMKATDEEYYQFYRLGYEAVNEVNQELGLVGKQKILIGGPVVTGSFIKSLTRFFELYQQDPTVGKTLDFVSWHEYTIPAVETAFREKQIRNLLSKHGIDDRLDLFVTEHNPYHYSEDKLEYHHQNAAGLVKTLYFSSLYSPNLKIMPWVLYHNSKLQTRFMWFDGPNDPETTYDQIKIFPSGVSMKWLAMHQGKEILVDNLVDGTDLVIASRQKDKVLVEAVNFGSSRPVILTLKNLKENFGSEKISVKKYLLDKKHNNALTDPKRTTKIDILETTTIDLNTATEVVLRQEAVETDGIVLWEIEKTK
ncbi:glycosyl hydrolase family 39 [Dyadobacter jejuensis]|uniref:Glycosyl hydrolase family 39 n=2 Tax=Dyadobacter jejuensis TaxID=1082580 RepID=A0A316A967_9BACT|nr:glycosyl hydrolase family 39 [Dyadobacter jejuensis]